MNAPAFWQSRGALSWLLLPFALLYDGAGRLRRALTASQPAGVPVICVGNLTLGGAGKTPVALHIGDTLARMGVRAFFLSRGYGGSARGPLLVDASRHGAAEAGDEPLLLARRLPTVVAKDRRAGAAFAIAHGAEAIIMDDGFQNPALAKTLSLVVIDGAYGFGNGFVFPAGPLRETRACGLARAQAAIVINRTAATPALPPGLPVFEAAAAPASAAPLPDGPLVAFCGIAHPQKFFAMLRGMGAALAETVSYPDHYPYTQADLARLERVAAGHGARLVTTAKDAARLPEAMQRNVIVIDLALAFADPQALERLLARALGRTA